MDENGSTSERQVSGHEGSDTAHASLDQAAHSDEPHGPSPFSSSFLSLRFKVVWGSVDARRDAQVRREEGDGECAALGDGTLSSASDRLESCEVGGVVVGVGVGVGGGDGGELVEDGVAVGGSKLGFTYGPGERHVDEGRKDL